MLECTIATPKVTVAETRKFCSSLKTTLMAQPRIRQNSLLQDFRVDKYCTLTLTLTLAQLSHRDRACSIDNFKGWVNLRLNFRLKSYFSHHCDITQFTLTYSIMSMLTFRMTRCGHIKYRILRHQKTRSISVRIVYHPLIYAK